MCSTSTTAIAPRAVASAIVYSKNGDPSSVLSAVSFPDLPPPAPRTANVRFLLSPINPADINVIEGVYPSRPSPSTDLSSDASAVFVAGNEGVAEVLSVGDGITHLKEKDWVVMTKPQMGTWMSSRNVRIEDVLKVDSSGLSAAQAATLTVNSPTAYNMLHDFVQLKEGDWVVQNGANSAVGQAVIQIAASKGVRTINFIRDRDNVESLKSHLKALGATHDVKLGLNCVGGKTTTLMARLLGENAHLVSYGAMSKDPLSLPTSLFIFKNLTCHGFWQTRWYDQKTLDERLQMMQTLTEHEILVIESWESDLDATGKVCTAIARLASGKYGKKVLLKIEETW
ncbi:hypothetical protein L210DRAFT_3612536 [Boletus edulis BED1]|uniref:enoyl-[acyl-carrier-protein] reductase n=1 Tax=Boletus edulis BED1 TaxID=1328754 RepID=A0AAD4GEM3_BOLED|nr:hypothetical protein L210DRAFT_3612536 [Boletus edulis BED1]